MGERDLPLQSLRKNLLLKAARNILQDYLPKQCDMPCRRRPTQFKNECDGEKEMFLEQIPSLEMLCKEISSRRTVVTQTDSQSWLKEQLPPQPITEATFKPHQLKTQLSSIRNRGSLKRILTERSEVSVKKKKNKTKYQRILEDFFKTKVKQKKNIKLDQIPNLRVKHTSMPHSTQENCQRNRENYDTFNNSLKRGNSVLHLNQKHKTCERKKEISQQMNTQGWLKMSFTQRQQKTITNKKQKQEAGLKAKTQKQVNGCTFKPVLTPYYNKKDSYADLYMQKIRRKLR